MPAGIVGCVGHQRRRLRSRLGQQGECVQVEDLLRVARDPGHEHVVAAVGADDHHRRGHRHHHTEEGGSTVGLPALLPGEVLDAVGEKLVVVEVDELLFVYAPILDAQAATEEVRGVGHRRPPGDRLPVDDHEGPLLVVAEEQVVEAVVAVDEPEGWSAVSAPGIGDLHERAAHLEVFGSHARGIALFEAPEYSRQERLVQRVGQVEPVGGAGRQVAEHRGMDAGQLTQRQPSLGDVAAGDLVTLLGVHDVFEHQREPALRRVVDGEKALRERVTDSFGARFW